MVWTPPTSKLKYQVSWRSKWTFRADGIKVPRVEGRAAVGVIHDTASALKALVSNGKDTILNGRGERI